MKNNFKLTHLRASLGPGLPWLALLFPGAIDIALSNALRRGFR